MKDELEVGRLEVKRTHAPPTPPGVASWLPHHHRLLRPSSRRNDAFMRNKSCSLMKCNVSVASIAQKRSFLSRHYCCSPKVMVIRVDATGSDTMGAISDEQA